MKIGIDCRMWNETGMGRYIRNTVSQLMELDNTNEYVLFMKSEVIDTVETPSNFKKVLADVPWHTFREQFILLYIFLKENLDLLHVPTPNMPVLYPKKFVVTIHDLTILRVKTGRATTLPYPLYLLKRLGFRINLLFAIARASKIFTVSKFVKNDIANTFKISASKIVLTPNAVEPAFKHKEDPYILEKYGIKPPYLFYIGNAHPHKNLERLILAFQIVHRSNQNLSLVIAGKRTFFHKRLEAELASNSIKDYVLFPGFIDDADLPKLYSSAEAYVNPSMYEGFGIQLLEAFACGTKVISANTTSLPEIGNDIAYYFDPKNTEEMAAAIIKALSENDALRKEKGLKRVQDYSWKQSATTILSTYNSLN